MKALVYKSPGRVAVEDVPAPVIMEKRDVLVRVTTAAICGSDLHSLHGLTGADPGTVLGHEFCGVVEEAGDGVSWLFKQGDRVLAAPQVACGRCYFCQRGMLSGCREMAIFGSGPLFGDLPGSQAQYIRVPFADVALLHIPVGLDDEDVIFTGDILSTAYMGIEGMSPGDTVAVLGAGPVGLMAVALARLHGASRVISIDPLEYRLQKAREMGADITVNPLREDPISAVYLSTGDIGADLVVEAVGTTDTFMNGMAMARTGGTFSALGIFSQPVEISNFDLLKNLTVRTGLGNPYRMEKLLSLIQNRRLDLRPVITHRMPLDQAEEAYRMFDAREDNVIKILLTVR
ncbi:MAG: zinc-dependent alcohol dehydrogenase [Desulfocucumaceae bacterium]